MFQKLTKGRSASPSLLDGRGDGVDTAQCTGNSHCSIVRWRQFTTLLKSGTQKQWMSNGGMLRGSEANHPCSVDRVQSSLMSTLEFKGHMCHVHLSSCDRLWKQGSNCSGDFNTQPMAVGEVQKWISMKSNGKVNEIPLFHATTKNDHRIIYESEFGFNVRMSKGRKWGWAIYFSEDASYCDRFAYCCIDWLYVCKSTEQTFEIAPC